MGDRSELPDCNLAEFGGWLIRRRRRFRVEGNSMLPLLQPGQEVLIDPFAYQKRDPQVGEIIVAEHPQRPGFRIIKRIEIVLPNAQYVLYGDNRAESSDSRQFGPVARSHLLGRVTCRFQ